MAIDVYVWVCVCIGFQETPQFRILVFLYIQSIPGKKKILSEHCLNLT